MKILDVLDEKDMEVLGLQCAQYLNEKIAGLKKLLESAEKHEEGSIFVELIATDWEIVVADFKVLLAVEEYGVVQHHYEELKGFFDTVPDKYIKAEQKGHAYEMLHRVREACDAVWEGILEDVTNDKEETDR